MWSVSETFTWTWAKKLKQQLHKGVFIKYVHAVGGVMKKQVIAGTRLGGLKAGAGVYILSHKSQPNTYCWIKTKL